jgi:PEP-CTERM motif
MKTTVALLLLAVSIADSTASQTFTNLNFERAQVVVNDPDFGFLDWNLAVPGWSPSSGNDTSSVYYRSPHLGISQYYLLVDSISFPSSLLAGRYSLAFASGHLTSDPTSPWVQAYISQTGSIPNDARSIRLSATGIFDVFVGGVSIPMQALGGNAYAGDISAFAGTTSEFRIVNTSWAVQDPVVADNIVFSSLSAPEPSSMALLGAGAIVSVIIWRRRVRPKNCIFSNMKTKPSFMQTLGQAQRFCC